MSLRDRIETDLRKVWTQWSTWVLSFLFFFGDIYNEIVSLVGYTEIPAGAKHALYGISVAGIAAKHWKQKSKDQP